MDNLSGRFLKDGAKVLAKPSTDLRNLSMTFGKFPDSRKFEKLKPIYEKDSWTEASNCRPISLLLLISRVIKKAIPDQTSAFLNSINWLYNYQSDFHKNHLSLSHVCLSFLSDNILIGSDQGLMDWHGFHWFSKSLWCNRQWQCIMLDETRSGETMTLSVINKINS